MQVVQTIDTLNSLNIRLPREITFRDPLNAIRHFSSKQFFQQYRMEKGTLLSICEELFDINEPIIDQVHCCQFKYLLWLCHFLQQEVSTL